MSFWSNYFPWRFFMHDDYVTPSCGSPTAARLRLLHPFDIPKLNWNFDLPTAPPPSAGPKALWHPMARTNLSRRFCSTCTLKIFESWTIRKSWEVLVRMFICIYPLHFGSGGGLYGSAKCQRPLYTFCHWGKPPKTQHIVTLIDTSWARHPKVLRAPKRG